MKYLFPIIFIINLFNCEAQQLNIVMPVAHTDFVNYACFSRNEKLAATVSWDNTIKIWDIQTGYLLKDLKGHRGSVWHAEFSHDDRYIVSCSNDSLAIVWEIESGKIKQKFVGHTGPVIKAIFNLDDSKIITASNDGTAKIWDRNNGQLLIDILGSKRGLTDINESYDHTKLITASMEGVARIYEINNGNLLKTLVTNSGEAISGAYFSKSGKKVLLSYRNSKVSIWDLDSQKWLIGFGRITSNKDDLYFHSMAKFSPDCSSFIMGTDSTIVNINSETFEVNSILKTVLGNITSNSFSNDGSRTLTTFDGKVALIFNQKTHKETYLFGHTAGLIYGAFSPSGKYCITTSSDNTAKIWNATNGNLIYDFNSGMKRVSSISLSSKDDILLSAGWDSSFKIWDLQHVEIKKYISGHPDYINQISFNNKGTWAVTSGAMGMAKIWDISSGSNLCSFGDFDMRRYFGTPKSFLCSQFSPDGNLVATISENGTISIWSSKSCKLIKELKIDPPPDKFYNSIQFSNDGNTILGPANGYTNNKCMFVNYDHQGKNVALSEIDSNVVKIYDAKSRELISKLIGHKEQIISFAFSQDDKMIITNSFDGTAKLWSVISGKLIFSLEGHSDIVFTSAFSKDNTKIFTGSWDGSLKVWDVISGKLVATIIPLNGLEYIAYLPSGYYKCTPGAAKLLHYVTPKLKVITFEQLDLKFNRPDLVLNSVGFSDSSLINSYFKAYLKRINRLRFDTLLFREDINVPIAEIQNRDYIKFDQTNNSLSIKIHAKDDKLLLDRFNVWLNEIPLWGVDGISLRKRGITEFDTSITILLSDSSNRIETSVTNVSGLESYRIPLDVMYTPKVPSKEKLHFVGIGIDHFNESKYNLSWSVKDIRNLAEAFKEKYGAYCIIDTLFDQNVSIEKVSSLKDKLKRSDINDKVILAYSGHGLLSDSLDYYLSTYNVNFHKPENAGLPYETLEDLLDGIPARKKLMLIDACHSGEVDKEEMLKYRRVEDSLKRNGVKGFDVLEDSTAQLGMKNSFELMQELFVNVGRSTGATIISAAAGTQFALEKGDLKNGVFTYSILELMKQREHVKVSELKNYVNARVSELTQGLQVPTSRSENKVMDWEVW